MVVTDAVTVDAAATFLRDHFDGHVDGVEPVGEGAWSRAFGFRQRGREYVIRFGGYPEDFAKDRRATRFASKRLPVPEIVEIGEALGQHYAISTMARGEYLEELDAAAWQTVLPAVVAALDALRDADVADTQGYGGWDGSDGNATRESWPEFLLAVAEDPVGRRGEGWPDRLSTMSPAADRLFTRGLAELAATVADVDRHLVHGDLINRNVLVAGDRITAVLDWGCGLYGDHLYDGAWLDFWAPWHPGLGSVGIADRMAEHHAAIALDVPGREDRWRACLIHVGLAHLAYNAATGNRTALAETADRLTEVL